jgi:hypothetical protein
MLRKGLLFASATLFGLASGMQAYAAPGAGLFAMQGGGAPAVKADYYYPGEDYGAPPDYSEVPPLEVPPYDEGVRPYYGRGLADGDVIGGALGLIGGALGGALHGPDYSTRPYYGPDYGRPYYYGEGPAGACGDSPYSDPGRGACLPDGGRDYWDPYPER